MIIDKMSTIQKTYRYQLKPCKQIENLLLKAAGCARYVYNYGLNKIKIALNSKTGIPTYKELANELPVLKRCTETSWLKEVHSQILQQSLKDLDRASKNFFNKIKKKQNPGKLRFKIKNQNDSFRYPQSIKCQNNKVYLPKIGWVKYINTQDINGTIKQANIKRELNQWFINIVCEIDIDISKVTINKDRAVGIDLGLSTLAYCSNGQIIENPRFLKKSLKKLRKEQKKLSRCKKTSKNREKQKLKVAKIHCKARNKRKDYLHKITTLLVKNHDLIAVEKRNG